MIAKKSHQKTQSTEIQTQAMLNYLSNREIINARFSNSPTFKLDIKAKQNVYQQSPFMNKNSSQPNLKVFQQQYKDNNIKFRQTQRKVQPSDLMKSKGFMSPKLASQERVSKRTQFKSGGNHIKTQPHSNQSSQNRISPYDQLQEEYCYSSKFGPKNIKANESQKTQPQSTSSKVVETIKQKAEQAILEMKQRQQDEIMQRLHFQKSLGIAQFNKNHSQKQLGQAVYLQQGHQKSNSVQFIENQKMETLTCSQPLIEVKGDKFKPITTRHSKQVEQITFIIQFNDKKNKITIETMGKKIYDLIEAVKDELNKQFTTVPHIVGIKTWNGIIPIDYILSQINRPLSLLSNCPNQPLILDPLIFSEIEGKKTKITLKDFEFIRCIGVGGFSKVYLVREKRSGLFYAMKLIEKKPIISQNKQFIIQNERDIMAYLNHPFIVNMHYAFESRRYLIFVLEYCSGGELFYLLRKVKRMSEEEAFFYFSEICLGMKHLHDNGIIYRDIKPENILIDFEGHVRIADFGLSKPNMQEEEIAYSFCGSPEYMAPEMLLKAGHTLSLDLYCLGALLYELITGLPPFYSRNTDEIYQRILNQKLAFPSSLQLSSSLKDLLQNLLAKNPKKRIEGIDNLLRHPWMTQWGDKTLYKNLIQKKIDPPFKPDYYEFNFDEEEFGKGESEFLTLIKQIQQSTAENQPKEIILRNFYYNINEINKQESTGGTTIQNNIKRTEERQKSKRMNTCEDEEELEIKKYSTQQRTDQIKKLKDF